MLDKRFRTFFDKHGTGQPTAEQIRDMSDAELVALIEGQSKNRQMVARMCKGMYRTTYVAAFFPFVTFFFLKSSTPLFYRIVPLLLTGSLLVWIAFLDRLQPRITMNTYRNVYLSDSLHTLGPNLFNLHWVLNTLRVMRRSRLMGPYLSKFEADSRTALLRLLPKVEIAAVHELALTVEDRTCMRNLLKQEDPELVLSLLSAMRFIGDSKDLPELRKLEAGKWSASKDPNIAAAAARCRESIEDRLADNATNATLLRASNSTGSGAELVRASGSANSNEDQLPRIVVGLTNEE